MQKEMWLDECLCFILYSVLNNEAAEFATGGWKGEASNNDEIKLELVVHSKRLSVMIVPYSVSDNIRI